MKLELYALLAMLAVSQAQADTNIPVHHKKAVEAAKTRPILDNKPTGTITPSPVASVAPNSKVNPEYPPAMYFSF
jgi:hypothetical protein